MSAVRSRQLSDQWIAWAFALDMRTQLTRAQEYVDLRKKAPGLVVFGARLLTSVRLAALPWTRAAEPDSE